MEHIADGTFFFDPDDTIYSDHFPQNPVVPGSLIVYAFMTAASQVNGVRGRCLVENFKFRQFIAPGEYAYGLRIQLNGPAGMQMKCELSHDGKTVVTGVLKYET